MELRAFNCGCNVIAFKKEDKKFGMVCAWATMVDYDHIGMLIGAQSITGKMIKEGDFVGVSALSSGQKDIAIKLGESHSNECNKFVGIELLEKDTALLIKDAKNQMFCKVVKITKLVDPNDNFVVLEVIENNSNKSKSFLTLEDVYPEE